MSSANLSLLSKTAAQDLRQTFAITSATHKPIKLTLLASALVHFAEFVICAVFFSHTAAPYFVPPVPTPLNGESSFLYAHSIIRQYGFFALELALFAVLIASHPLCYRPFTILLALSHLMMAGLGAYTVAVGSITSMQFLPAFGLNLMLAWALWHWQPERAVETETHVRSVPCKTVLGLRLSEQWQQRALQVLLLITGGFWILWGLGSTLFWEIGTANISSDRTMEQNLLLAMQANALVRNQQGMMLLSIGLITAWAAWQPLAYRKVIAFVIVQQVINAASAVVELWFGAIVWSQFLTVFSVQVLTLLLFSALYPVQLVEAEAVSKVGAEM